MIFRRIFTITILKFLLPILFLLGGVVAVWLLYPLYGPITPETAGSKQLITWIYLREFPQEKEVTISRVLHRLEELYGHNSNFEPDFQFTTEQRVSIQGMFPDFETIPLGEMSRIRIAPSKVERNLRYLVKLWLFERMNAYEEAEMQGKEAKDEFMDDIVVEIDWWNGLCVKFMVAAELRLPNLLELLRIVDGFVADIALDCSPEEAVRLEKFYEELKSGYTYRKLKPLFDR